MKKLYFLIAALAVFSAGCAGSKPGPWQGEPVTAQASASYDDDNPDIGRGKALMAAQQKAVEQAVSLFMSYSDMTENPAAVKRITDKAPSYITRYKVTQEAVRGATISVTIRAYVQLPAISAALEDVHLSHLKRARKLILAPADAQAAAQGTAVNSAVISVLGPKNYNLYEGPADEGDLKNSYQVADYAKRLGGSLVLAAAVSAEKVQGITQFAPGMESCRTATTLKLISADGRVLAQSAKTATSIDATQDAACQKAIASTAGDAAKDITPAIDGAVTGEANIEVSILGASITQLNSLQEVLRSTDGVEDISLKTYTGGDALVDVYAVRLSPQELAARLIKKSPSQIDILSISPRSLELRPLE